MDIYSSCLWHEGAESDLTHLCHELQLYNPGAAEAWCAVGNLKRLICKNSEATVSVFRSLIYIMFICRV